MTPVKLDGSKPLWATASEYADWITAHQDEIYDAYHKDDDNADLIVTIIDKFADVMTLRAMAALQIAVERYIAAHYPEIAIIVEKESEL